MLPAYQVPTRYIKNIKDRSMVSPLRLPRMPWGEVRDGSGSRSVFLVKGGGEEFLVPPSVLCSSEWATTVGQSVLRTRGRG